MSYYSVYRRCVMFREVWRSKVKEFHDVQNVFFETTMHVYVCFVNFYMFVLNETHVVGHKLVYEHIFLVETSR